MSDPIHTVAGHVRVSDQLLERGGWLDHPVWIGEVLEELRRPDPLAAARRRWRESLEPWPVKLRRRMAPARQVVRDARVKIALRVAPWLTEYDEDY